MKGKQEIFTFIEADTPVETMQAIFTGAELRTAQDAKGRTVLHRCAEVGNTTLLVLFLEAKYRVLADIEGNTPLQVAVQSQQWACVESLIQNWKTCLGAMKNKAGENALHTLCKTASSAPGYEKCLVEFCTRFKHLLNDKTLNATGETALCIACRCGNYTAAKVLLEAGASCSIEDKNHKSPFQLVLGSDHQNIIDLLEEHGAGDRSFAFNLQGKVKSPRAQAVAELNPASNILISPKSNSPSPRGRNRDVSPAVDSRQVRSLSAKAIGRNFSVSPRAESNTAPAATTASYAEAPTAVNRASSNEKLGEISDSDDEEDDDDGFDSPSVGTRNRRLPLSRSKVKGLLRPADIKVEMAAAEALGRTALYDVGANADLLTVYSIPAGEALHQSKADLVVIPILNSCLLDDFTAQDMALDVLPFSVVTKLKKEIDARYMGELSVSQVAAVSRKDRRYAVVPLCRNFNTAVPAGCIYDAVWASMSYALRYHCSRVLVVLPRLTAVSWKPYTSSPAYPSAIFQAALAVQRFQEHSKSLPDTADRAPAFHEFLEKLRVGPEVKDSKDVANVLASLLEAGTLLKRGLMTEDEANWLLAQKSNEAMQVLLDLVSATASVMPEKLTEYMKQRVLTSPDYLRVLFEKLHDGTLVLPSTISMDDLEIGGRIGTGGTATVYHGKFSGKAVAIKVFNEALDVGMLTREVALMTLLNHPMLVEMYGAALCTTTRGNSAVVLELAEKGSLYDVLRDPEILFNWRKKIDMALQVASAMEYLHTYGIIHRDLKSLNVLVMRDMTLKLTDYGTSRVISENMTQNVGTVAWIAPEVLESESYSVKADVYSYGMLLFEIATGETPFAELKSFQVPQKVLRGTRPTYEKSVPKKWQKLTKRCWHASPGKRPTFTKIIAALHQMKSGTKHFM